MEVSIYMARLGRMESKATATRFFTNPTYLYIYRLLSWRTAPLRISMGDSSLSRPGKIFRTHNTLLVHAKTLHCKFGGVWKLVSDHYYTKSQRP
jgi:hypothetical protein